MLKPVAAGDWNFAHAAHLLNRAGFGGTPAEIERLAALKPEQAIASLVDFEKIPDDTKDPDWARPDPARVAQVAKLREMTEEQRKMLRQQQQRGEREHMLELRGWWLNRMAHGPRPLQEKMTLFWHGHFATSMEKVRDGYYMWRQNELFRRLATGSWLQLLCEMGKDPAMLIWLDQAQSRKEHPNENFAREVMELFALGEGHYTEKDIAEAARAFTGWGLDRATQKFVDRPRAHDDGLKTIFGKSGNFDGDQVLALIVEQPQAARFITAKLWSYFAGTPISAELNDALADVFRKAENRFKPVLRAMFLSREFYAPDVVRAQVKSPVQWLVMAVRQLERDLPPPLVCTALTRSLGQELFLPPNVKGWDGGLTWITTNNLLTRYNESATLVFGDLKAVMGAFQGSKANQARVAERRLERLRISGVDPEKLFSIEERHVKDKFIAALERRFLQASFKPQQEKALREFLDARGPLDPEDILGAIRLVMCTPDYQLT
jgi:uncharacterized protein (DUF1800 family)